MPRQKSFSGVIELILACATRSHQKNDSQKVKCDAARLRDRERDVRRSRAPCAAYLLKIQLIREGEREI
jgi:hypothetical protein